MNDMKWLLHQEEGQFFERKSCYDDTRGAVQPRDVREVAKNVAEAMAAMANADGGSLALGIENDGRVSGMDYDAAQIKQLRQAPVTQVRPPLHPRFTETTLQGFPVLVFEVDWSPDVHQLSDGRYLLRINDSSVPFPASEIEAIKEGKRRRLTESRYLTEASLNDLDLDLIAETTDRAGLDMSAEAVLLHYRVAERREGKLVLTLAALLLFGKDPVRWHPRCGIDFTHYKGSDRKLGAALNIIRRVRIEAPLVRLIEEAYKVVQSRMDERQPLVDLFLPKA